MHRVLPVLTLVVAGAALFVAWRAQTESEMLRAELDARDGLGTAAASEPGRTGGDVAARLERVEARLDRVDPRREDAPSLAPRAPDGALLPGVTAGGVDPDVLQEQVSELVGEELDRAVDQAVAAGTRRVLAKTNKKPSLGTFSEVLGLDEEQRTAVVEQVVRAQDAIREVLSTPTDDGEVFLEGMVERMARSMAQPGAEVGWKPFVARIMTESFPGTSETFGARVEAIKQRLRGEFRRTFTDGQWAEFETWQMDPTEIKDVPGSPYAEVMARVQARARELGFQADEDR